MTVISASIMHAPWATARKAHVAAALDALRDGDDVVSNSVVVEDAERSGVWPCGKRAIQAALSHQDATHILVLQDDLLFCRSFAKALRLVVDAKPAHVISLFSMSRGVVLEAKTRGSSWAWGPDAAYGQAIVMPVEMAADFLRWEPGNIRDDFPSYDNRIATYARATGQGVWVPCPNLVDHAMPADSLLGYSNRVRVARWFLGDMDPSLIDWRAGADDPVRCSGTVDYGRSMVDAGKLSGVPCAPRPTDPLAAMIAEARRDPHLRRCIKPGQRHEPLLLRGRIVGFVTPHEQREGWRAGPIYVTPSARKQGVMRAFYEAHRDRTWLAAIKSDNEASEVAHERCGFARLRRCKLGWIWRRGSTR